MPTSPRDSSSPDLSDSTLPIVVDLTALGLTTPALHLTGKDARSFLHRLSTQALLDDDDGATAKLTCLLDKKGKVHDVVQVGGSSDDVWAVGWPGASRSLFDLLDPFHFAEQMEMQDAAVASVVIIGAGEGAYTARVDGDVHVWGLPDVLVDGEATSASLLWSADRDALDAVVATYDATTLDADGFADLRLQNGWPLVGVDVGPFTNPLEVDLHDALSWTKGCYVGQEVVSRIDNYDKQKKRLVRVVAEAGGALDDNLTYDVHRDGATIGKTTSVHGASGQALALLKIAHDEVDGADVRLVVDGVDVAATTTSRPWAQPPHND